MMECMKPASPGPKLNLSYKGLNGTRDVTISLPITVTSFNESLSLSAQDFAARWQMLVQPGQESMEVFSPSSPINVQQIHNALSSALKFGRIKGMPDESDYVIYGAATLRTGAQVPGGGPTDKVSIGCLIKIEMNVQANALRVTARTIHPSATNAIMATAKSLLS
jgi:AP-2 complex subunit alpha